VNFALYRSLKENAADHLAMLGELAKEHGSTQQEMVPQEMCQMQLLQMEEKRVQIMDTANSI
jgi:hypothetical protein